MANARKSLYSMSVKLTAIRGSAIPPGPGLQTFYGSLNSPRATTTADPPTSTFSTRSGDPSTRA
jgi:hypothetical protein